MARLISTEINPIIGLVIKTIKEDDSVDVLNLTIDSEVEGLRYLENKEIKTASGRVSDIKCILYGVSKKISSITSLKSSFASNVLATTMIVDYSTDKHSQLVEIPINEIIEKAGVEDVKRIKYFLKYGFKIKTSLTDGSENEFIVNEGDVLTGVKCLGKNGVETFSGKVGCIGYDGDLEPTVVYFNVNGKLKAVDAIALISVESITPVVGDDTSLTNAIAAATNGIVNLDSGEFNDAVTISNDITIYGNKAGIPGTSFKNRDKVGTTGETVLGGKLTISAGANVVFDGVTFNKDALIVAPGGGELTIRNCRMLDLNLPETGKLYPIMTTGDTDPIKLSITNTFFGDNVGDGSESGKVYNLMELNAPMADGSVISNNYFSNACQTHNSINVYAAVEDATITISNNYWEKSANAIRIGVKGEPRVTFFIENNIYNSTDEDEPNWAGLVLIQPYGTKTTSMALMTVIINNTKHFDEYQIWYKYAGSNDMQFTDNNVPTVIVDGVTELQPIVG